MRTRRWLVGLFALVMVLGSSTEAFTAVSFAQSVPIIRVDANSTAPTPDGATWNSAYPTLPAALADPRTSTGAEIWVVTGTYTPGNVRTDTFQLANNVAIYGGFAGNETVRSQRNPDPETNGTILSGDLNGDDGPDTNNDGIPDTNRTDNAYHVVTGSGTNNTALLDGFTITAGNADGTDSNSDGGGLFTTSGSPTVTNVLIQGNTASRDGGGVFNNSTSNPVLTNLTIQDNNADNQGGGIANLRASSPMLTNVLIARNSSMNGDGGGMYNFSNSNAVLTNVTIQDNTTNDEGGGIANSISSPILTNVTIQDNRSLLRGGGIANLVDSNPVLTNVTIQGNQSNDDGGGLYNNRNSHPILTNVTIRGNDAVGSFSDGGGIFNRTSDLTLINVAIQRNSTMNGEGGGVYSDGSSTLTLTNVTIQNNTTGSGGGGFFQATSDSTATFQNSIIWDNAPAALQVAGSGVSTYDFSLVQGLNPPGTGNLDGTDPTNDPQFVDAVNGDLRLLADSPAIDVGNAQLLTGDILTDLGGNDRVVDGNGENSPQVDLGAFEYQRRSITFDVGRLTVTEGGSVDAYSVTLDTQPYADVVITLSSDDGVALAPATLTFTPANWDVPQTITITARDDGISESTAEATIDHTITSDDRGYTEVVIADLMVTISDGDNDPDNSDNTPANTSLVYLPLIARS